jgi:F-type H+-transporting ATPase subunit epsilon
MIDIEIITPEKVTYTGKATLVTVPTADGILGIAQGHLPLLALLKPGEVVVKNEQGKTEHLVVAGGFVEVAENGIHVLADLAEHADDLDIAQIQEAIKRAEASKAEAKGKAELGTAIATIEYNLVRLKLANRKHAHPSRTTRPLE